MHIWGSSELLQTLIAAELVDVYRIWIFPLVLGEGKRLFENGVPPRGLTLDETRSTPRGVLVNTYHPTGPLPRGELSQKRRRETGSAEEIINPSTLLKTGGNLGLRSMASREQFIDIVKHMVIGV